MTNPKKWLAITVNLGDPKFGLAEQRLRNQALAFTSEIDLVVVNKFNLFDYASETTAKYSHLLNPEVPGYGYWIWKAEICKTALISCRELGYRGVIYLDIGCELFESRMSRFTLRILFRIAMLREALVFTSGGTDLQYTKRYVLEKMNPSKRDSSSLQVAATWFIVTPEKSIDLISEWSDLCLSDTALLDLSGCELAQNNQEFLTHRSDQSVFSLLCKKRKIRSLSCLDYSGRNMRFHRIRRHFYPIWTARNLSSKNLDSI